MAGATHITRVAYRHRGPLADCTQHWKVGMGLEMRLGKGNCLLREDKVPPKITPAKAIQSSGGALGTKPTEKLTQCLSCILPANQREPGVKGRSPFSHGI